MQKYLGAMLVLIAVVLAACSGGSDTPSTSNFLAGVAITTPTPTPAPTATPTPIPNAVNVLVNPGFELAGSPSTTFNVGTEANPAPVPVVVPTGWYVCQNLSEDQPTGTAISANTFVQLMTSATSTAVAPGLTAAFHGGSGALFLGNTNASSTGIAGRTKGGFGLCQDAVVPASAQLTFFVNEGSGGTASTTTGTGQFLNPAPAPSAASFGTGSAQEAAILNTATHTVHQTLFYELDLAQTDPAAYATASNTAIGFQSGYVQKGPYDLSALAGQTVTIYFGIFSSTAATTSFTFMAVDDVSLAGFPAPASLVRRPAATTRLR
jgi:hypothetical protein